MSEHTKHKGHSPKALLHSIESRVEFFLKLFDVFLVNKQPIKNVQSKNDNPSVVAFCAPPSSSYDISNIDRSFSGLSGELLSL